MVVEPAKAIAAAFKLLVKGTKCRVSVGVLKDRQRSGWLLSGTAKAKELVLFKPDARRDLGKALAKATKLKLPTSWTPPADDWFTFGLGVSLATKGD